MNEFVQFFKKLKIFKVLLPSCSTSHFSSGGRAKHRSSGNAYLHAHQHITHPNLHTPCTEHLITTSASTNQSFADQLASLKQRIRSNIEQHWHAHPGTW